MKGVLGQMTTGAAPMILKSANSKEIKSSTKDCVRCCEEKKEHNEGAPAPQWILRVEEFT